VPSAAGERLGRGEGCGGACRGGEWSGGHARVLLR